MSQARPALTPSQRALRARIGAYALHARHDPRETTARARAAFLSRFEREVDPDGSLNSIERARRAEAARKAYFARLAYRSAVARGRKSRKRTSAPAEPPAGAVSRRQAARRLGTGTATSTRLLTAEADCDDPLLPLLAEVRGAGGRSHADAGRMTASAAGPADELADVSLAGTPPLSPSGAAAAWGNARGSAEHASRTEAARPGLVRARSIGGSGNG